MVTLLTLIILFVFLAGHAADENAAGRSKRWGANHAAQREKIRSIQFLTSAHARFCGVGSRIAASMSHEVLPYGVAITLAGVWALMVPRLVLRCALGPKVPLNPFKRQNVELRPRDSGFLYGFCFATAMASFDLTLRYSRWWIYGNPSDRPGLSQIVEVVFTSLLSGCLFGLFTIAFDGRTRSSD